MHAIDTIRRTLIAMSLGFVALGIGVSADTRPQSTVEKAATTTADKSADAAKAAAKGTKKAATETADKTEDAAKATAKGTKKAGVEIADKSEDVKDQTVKASKKTGNWFSRMWKKIF